MPSYSDLAAQVADDTEAKAVALWERQERGAITVPEFVAAATVLVEVARARAGAFAAVTLAERLSEVTGVSVPPPAIPVPAADVRAVVATVTTEAAPVDAIGVVVRDQTFTAGREVFAEGLKRAKVPGWRRAVNKGACKACRDLGDSRYIPMSVPIWHHKGCGCYQIPVL